MQKNYGKAAREMRQQAEVFLNKKTEQSELCSSVVEVTRLELAASWSRTMRATKLRYTSQPCNYSTIPAS